MSEKSLFSSIDMKRDGVFVSGVSLFQDAKSPYWWAQWSLSDGSRVKKSTKVPLVGGLFQGERLSKPQAKRRALLVAQELAAPLSWRLSARIICRCASCLIRC